MRNNISAVVLSAAICTGLYSQSLGQATRPTTGQASPRSGLIDPYTEKFRPQFHFSPRSHWMNDPNGMVFFRGVYHLFFQYYPGDIVWGPMHWGHAVSKDLIHWQELPIALFLDSLGYIFSGSAVVDSGNTSGFGKHGQIPLVAIFTQHDPIGEKKGAVNFQNQSIAYSLDEGKTWTKYENNPVLKNPGIRDFRDPKVTWYAPAKKWVMTLAVTDHIEFWSSPDLKSWTKESDFGVGTGAHGGVWECPDLFPMELDGSTYWVLLVSINPGGPNGGSGTQYFIGRFDGKEFLLPGDLRPSGETSDGSGAKWIDYGPDDYAGVTWGNTGRRRIFLGWMSNWLYAGQVPTSSWRSAMTIPRELRLQRSGGDIYLLSRPVKEFAALTSGHRQYSQPQVSAANADNAAGLYMVKFQAPEDKDLTITLSNDAGEQLILGYEKETGRYFMDRSRGGKTDFNPDFPKKAYSPRLSAAAKINISLLVDASSAELFADDGLTVMTILFFPSRPLSKVAARSGTQSLRPL